MRRWIPALVATSIVLTVVVMPGADAVTPGLLRGVIAATGGKTLRYVDPVTGRTDDILTGATGRPAWNANGTRIAVQVESQIIVMNTDGSGRFPLRQCNASPSFDPNGGWVACSRREYATSGIFLVSLDGQVVTPLVDGADFPEFSPDGQWISYIKDGQLRKIHPDGTADTLVTATPSFVTGPISWSRITGTIAVRAVVNDQQCVVLVDPTSGTTTKIPGSRTLAAPSWSPDGQQLAGVLYTPATSERSLVTLLPDGSDVVTVPTRSVALPAWQPATVTIDPSRTEVTSGQLVRFDMRLAWPGPGQTLYLQRKLPRGDWHNVASDRADSDGNASVTVTVRYNAAYRVLWLGDDTRSRAWSTPTRITAVLALKPHTSGDYGHKGKWNLVHAGQDFVLTVTLRPPRKDDRVHFIAYYKVRRFWQFAWQVHYRTYQHGSKTGVRWFGMDAGFQGRILAEWHGDALNAGTKTAWVYVRVTQ